MSTLPTQPPADDPPADDKDWTWVLERPCPDCGFVARDCPPQDVARLLRRHATAWKAVLDRPDARNRPAEAVWSPLEYGCHVRDCCAVFDERVRLLLAEPDPQFANWDQDATARDKQYHAADLDQVAAEIALCATTFAATLDSVGDGQWDRTGRRSNGSVFTVATLTQYFAHDLVHHGWDVGVQVE
ncbi:MAG: DinB family protein [Actinomycetales bacterium]